MMKKSVFQGALAALFFLSVPSAKALDVDSYDFIEYLLTLKAPGAPDVFEDAVIFSAPSNYKRVGIAFAHERFAKVHPFKKLMVPISDTAQFNPSSKIPPELLRDSGILFYAYTPDTDAEVLEYRLIVDGVWCTDPLNPQKRRSAAGLEISYIKSPPKKRSALEEGKKTGVLSINYKSRPNEMVSVAGDFNGWDPFMYELKETGAGIYSIDLPLPKGTWRYALFQNGQRVLDSANTARVWEKDGKGANLIKID